MTSMLPRHQVEQFSIQAMPTGEGFVMDLANGRNEAVRLEFPSWMVHQLMRVFPQLDAALHQQQPMLSSALIAYPVIQWTIERSGLDQGVALSLHNDRGVEIGFHFGFDDARAFHRELGEAIARAAAAQAAHGTVSMKVN